MQAKNWINQLKSGIRIIVFLALVLGMTLSVTNSSDAAELYYNSTKVPTVDPLINTQNIATVMAPASTIAGSLGFSYEYHPVSKALLLKKEGQTIIFFVNKKYYSYNQKNIPLSLAPVINNNRIYLPLQPIVQADKKELTFDSQSGNYVIKDENYTRVNNTAWEYQLDKECSGQIISVSDGLLVPHGTKLSKFDLQGQEVWSVVLGKTGASGEKDQVVGTPLLAPDGFIYVATSDIHENEYFSRYIYKLSPTGDVLWKNSYVTNYEGYDKPFELTADKKYIYVSQKDQVQVYEQNGQKRWQYRTNGYISEKTVAINNQINTHKNYCLFLDLNPGKIIKLDEKGNRLWRNNLPTGGTPQYVAYDDASGYAVVTENTSDGQTIVTNFDIIEEEQLTSEVIPGQLVDRPQIKNGQVILLTDKMLVAKTVQGKNLWHINLPTQCKAVWTNEGPVTVDATGTLTYISLDGKIQKTEKLNTSVKQILLLKDSNWIVYTGENKIIQVKKN